MASGRSRSWEQSPRKSDRIVRTTSTGASSSRVASIEELHERRGIRRRCVCSAPLAWKRNSSSNWSTTTSTRPPSSAPPCRTASASPKPLRRSVASTCAAAFTGSASSVASTSGAARARARLWIGLAPGRNAAMRQCDPTRGENPPRSAGSRPGVHERRLPAGRGAHHGHEPRSRQLAEQLVDVCAAAEEQVRLRRSKGPQSRIGVERGRRTSPPGRGRGELRDEGLEHRAGGAGGPVEHHRLVGVVGQLVGRGRLGNPDRAWPGTARGGPTRAPSGCRTASSAPSAPRRCRSR